MDKHFPIFHNRLAGFLMYKGFVLQNIEVSRNSKDRKLNIYYFNSSKKLLDAINEFKELRHQ